MLPRRTRQQKIVISCIVNTDDHVLLLRGSQYLDPASRDHTSYFNLPRFSLPLGADPEEVIMSELKDQFGQTIDELSVRDVRVYHTEDGVQIVELIYATATTTAHGGQPGRFQFVHRNELERYVVPEELDRLRRLLGE